MKRSLILLAILCVSFSAWQGCHKKNGPNPNQLSAKCANHFIEPGDSCMLYLPTSFTPNGDGINDIYRFLIDPIYPTPPIVWDVFTNYHEAIYKTDGSLINQGVNLVNGWEGTDSLGNTMPAAKYYVTIQYTTNTGVAVDTGTYVYLLATDSTHHCTIKTADSADYYFGDQFDPATGQFIYATEENFCN